MHAPLERNPVASPQEREGATAGEDAARESEGATLQILTSVKGIEPALRDLVAAQNKPKDKRDIKTEIADLKAQEEMALWAEPMFWASASTVLLTFVGLALILGTLVYSRRAAVHAKEMVGQAARLKKRIITFSEDMNIGEVVFPDGFISLCENLTMAGEDVRRQAKEDAVNTLKSGIGPNAVTPCIIVAAAYRLPSEKRFRTTIISFNFKVRDGLVIDLTGDNTGRYEVSEIYLQPDIVSGEIT